VAAQVAGAREAYRERRERFLAALADRGLEARGASGLNVWVAVAEEATAAGALLHRGWVLAPGAPYRLPGSTPALRVTIATLAGAEAERLADDLAAVLAPARLARSG